MALTIAVLHDDFTYQRAAETRAFGLVTGTITWDSSYPTGGEAITVGVLNLNGLASSISSIICSPSLDGTTLYRYDSANAKIKAFNNSSAQSVTETIETGLTPSSHVTTLAATPITMTFVDVVTSGATGTGGKVRRHTDQAPGAGEFEWTGTTVTTNAVDDATEVDVGYLVQSAVVTEVANTTDLSGANKVCFFWALLAG